jgi:hypothetical protein
VVITGKRFWKIFTALTRARQFIARRWNNPMKNKLKISAANSFCAIEG